MNFGWMKIVYERHWNAWWKWMNEKKNRWTNDERWMGNLEQYLNEWNEWVNENVDEWNENCWKLVDENYTNDWSKVNEWKLLTKDNE
jgi:hypothetical protein